MTWRVRPRVAWAIVVLVAWCGGIVAFARRETHRSLADQLLEISLRVAPGARYYQVERGGQHVGFASTTVDTLARTLQITDYAVLDAPEGSGRLTVQTIARFSRGLVLHDFQQVETRDTATVVTNGWMRDDSTLAYSRSRGSVAGDTVSIPATRGIVLSGIVPTVVALGGPLRVGARRAVPTFDLDSLQVRTRTVRIVAESTFVVADSAVYDSARGRWTPARSDTVHAWRLEEAGHLAPVWIDELGQPVSWQTPDGVSYRRMAYELAFENWRTLRPRAAIADRVGDVQPHSLIASLPGPATQRPALRVLLHGMPLRTFQLTGWGQSASGDTVLVRRAAERQLLPSFTRPPDARTRQRYARALGSAPFVEVDAPAVAHTAARIVGTERNPRRAVEQILAWMRDSLTRAPNRGLPSALQLLRDRRGDVDAYAQLFVALARAAGIPARSVAGVWVGDQTMYPHAWAEVMLQGWVAVDPVLAQFPADASHLRLLADGASTFEDFVRAIRPLRITRLATHDTQPTND